jgi:putative hydrolase of the HAD superfamily
MIKAVIFDLDNTLIDFMRMKRQSCGAAISAMIDAGLKLNKRKAMQILFKLYDRHGIEYGKIFQKFLIATKRKVDYKLLSSAIVAYRKMQSGFLIPYPGVKKTLVKLKENGFKLAILSDAPRFKAWMRLTELSIVDFFDVVLTLGDTKQKKPGKIPFRLVLKKLDFKPEEVLMIGDNIKRDITGANSYGIKTVLAKYGCLEKFRKRAADFEISSIEELLKVIERLK